MVTPSLVMVGAPNFLSMTTLRPRGPRVTLTASASLSTPRSRERRASSLNLMILGMPGPLVEGSAWVGRWEAGPDGDRPGDPRESGRPGRSVSAGGASDGRRSLLHDGEQVAGGEDEVVLAAVLDLGAAVLRVDDHVADVHVERDAVAVVVDAAGAHGDDGALLGLLLGGVRDDQTGGGGGLGLVGLDHDPVLQRLDADLGSGRHVGDAPFGVGRLVDGGADAVARTPGTRRRGGRAPARVGWHSTHESANHSTGSLVRLTSACATLAPCRPTRPTTSSRHSGGSVAPRGRRRRGWPRTSSPPASTCCTGSPACAPRWVPSTPGPPGSWPACAPAPARCSATTPTSSSSPPTRSSRPAARSSPPGGRPGCWRAGRPPSPTSAAHRVPTDR